MIKFTIITCTYNAGHELQRTTDSVLRQTYPEVEHIIQDGCSRDKTLEIANEYKQVSDQESSAHDVIIVTETDGGLYDAMNRGLKRATGDYVVFLNAGDKLPDSDTLEQLAAAIGKATPLPGVLYGDTNIVDDLDADSLDFVEMITSIEDEFNIVVTDEKVGDFKTVRQVVEFLETLVK